MWVGGPEKVYLSYVPHPFTPLSPPSGKLVVHNKSLGGGRGTMFVRRKQRTTLYKPSRFTDQQKMMEKISEVSTQYLPDRILSSVL